MTYITTNPNLEQDYRPLEPHNAHIVTPRGNRISVNISPEAAVVWARFGFRVEWFATRKAVA